ncbi:calcium/sodium antiporter [Clostridiisalibacter paucivorans]|uniref:calcium/sodium antiporter n=1 Tax=Clostridiisalibacter paucivorans TaxID=408753 RepID=UPI00047BB199|nr:calcium/sodium antiporter [Clostridiisalibacter paucivorans]
MEYIILILGFIFLIKGADFFVDGASSFAKIFNVPMILIGLTIVAFGTSAPEAAVSISAVLKGSNNIAVGNIIGSSIFNILVVVGISAIIKPININTKTISKEFPFLLLSLIVFYILISDISLQGDTINMLSKGDGMILLALFMVFVYYLIEMAVTDKNAFEDDIKGFSMSKSVILTVIGLVGIVIGGNMVVDSSSKIAMNFGMGETLVGLTIVALGTSLPELVTSIVAAYKGENEIAIGNVIGSNIFNMLLILGITSIIKPIYIESKIFFDMSYLLGATVLTYILIIKEKKATRYSGIVMSIFYIGYVGYIIMRN